MIRVDAHFNEYNDDGDNNKWEAKCHYECIGRVFLEKKKTSKVVNGMCDKFSVLNISFKIYLGNLLDNYIGICIGYFAICRMLMVYKYVSCTSDIHSLCSAQSVWFILKYKTVTMIE